MGYEHEAGKLSLVREAGRKSSLSYYWVFRRRGWGWGRDKDDSRGFLPKITISLLYLKPIPKCTPYYKKNNSKICPIECHGGGGGGRTRGRVWGRHGQEGGREWGDIVSRVVRKTVLRKCFSARRMIQL